MGQKQDLTPPIVRDPVKSTVFYLMLKYSTGADTTQCQEMDDRGSICGTVPISERPARP